jgi:hypothetical protein
MTDPQYNNLANIGIGGAVGSGLAGMLGGLFDNPYKDMMNTYSKGMNPYLNQDKSAMGQAGQQFNQNINNPTGLENNIMSKYQASPWATYQQNQLLNQANRVGAASGDSGSPAEQQALMNKSQGVVSQDQQRFLQNAMTPYNQALQNRFQQGMGGQNMANQFYGNMSTMQGQVSNQPFQSGGAFMGGLGSLIGHLL